MIEDIFKLLVLFQGIVPDKQSNQDLMALVQNTDQWGNAHDLFDSIRTKTLKAEKKKDRLQSLQYLFEEACAKSIYNTYCYSYEEDGQFDPDSPHWIIKNALNLAYELGLETDKVLNIVAPNK